MSEGQPDVSDFHQLKTWLETRSREERSAFAARAALRILPVTVGAKEAKDWRRVILSPVLRCALISVAAPVRSPAEMNRAAVDAARAAVDAARAAGRAGGAYSYATGDADAAARVDAHMRARADASSAARAPAYATEAADATRAAYASYAAYAATAGAARTVDKAKIEHGIALVDLIGAPLWHGTDDLGDMEGSIADWRAALSEAEAPHEGWQVWLDWYDCLLKGHTPNIPLMTEIALKPNGFWERDVVEVNADIAVMVEEHGGWDLGKARAPTKDDIAALLQNDEYGFGLTDGETAFEIDASASFQRTDVEGQLSLLRLLTAEALEALRKSNTEWAGRLITKLELFQQMTTGDTGQVAQNAKSLWVLSSAFSNALDQDVKERAKNGGDGLLRDEQEECLNNLLLSSGAFVRSFPEVSALDDGFAIHRGIADRRQINNRLTDKIFENSLLERDSEAIFRILSELKGAGGPIGERSSFVADNLVQKISRRATAVSAVALAGVSGGVFSEIGTELVQNPEIARACLNFIISSGDDLLALGASIPPDLGKPLIRAVKRILASRG